MDGFVHFKLTKSAADFTMVKLCAHDCESWFPEVAGRWN